MSTYVMSDIHGCYDDMLMMIEKIKLSDEDVLVFAGDYIDRGPKSYEMIKWIEKNLYNAIFLKGNHEVEFAYGISLMLEMCKKNEWSEESLEDTRIVFALIKQASQGVFDYYGTIQNLIEIHGCTLSELSHYANMFEEFPLFYLLEVSGRNYVIVHAGYIDTLEGVDTERAYESIDEFYLYARDDAYIYGGIEHGVVVAGHTPTTLEEELPFNNGDVYKSYDEDLDCTFYDIDCGCSAKGKRDGAKLACIRLNDEQIYYI